MNNTRYIPKIEHNLLLLLTASGLFIRLVQAAVDSYNPNQRSVFILHQHPLNEQGPGLSLFVFICCFIFLWRIEFFRLALALFLSLVLNFFYYKHFVGFYLYLARRNMSDSYELPGTIYDQITFPLVIFLSIWILFILIRMSIIFINSRKLPTDLTDQ